MTGPTTPQIVTAADLKALSDGEFTRLLEKVDAGEVQVPEDEAAYDDFRATAWARQFAVVSRARRRAREEAEDRGERIAKVDGEEFLPTSPPSWFQPGRRDGRIISSDVIRNAEGDAVDIYGERVPERSGDEREPLKAVVKVANALRLRASREE